MILGKIKANTKAKAEPSHEEMLAVVAELLKKVDFDIVSSLITLLMFVSEFYCSFLCCGYKPHIFLKWGHCLIFLRNKVWS